MEHLAIMKKSWHLTEKILDGRKTIESRWYMTRRDPYGKISQGDVVYFKESGEPVRLKADVSDVKQFSDLTPGKVSDIFKNYEGICSNDIKSSIQSNAKKRYCMLIFLKNPQRVEPFEIDKKGYGIMSAWICINKINDIKKK
jgi:ASC-1-like (ASCH) protein